MAWFNVPCSLWFYVLTYWGNVLLAYWCIVLLPVPAYNDRVLAFLRQPNITDVLKERGRTVSLSSQLKSKIIQIRSDGISALERFANDVDLITLLRYDKDHFCLFLLDVMMISVKRERHCSLSHVQWIDILDVLPSKQLQFGCFCWNYVTTGFDGF